MFAKASVTLTDDHTAPASSATSAVPSVEFLSYIEIFAVGSAFWIPFTTLAIVGSSFIQGTKTAMRADSIAFMR